MPEKEEEAAELIRRTIPLLCGNPVQSFRRKSCSGQTEIDSEYGEDVSRLPLLQTDRIQDVSKMLKRSREYPHLLGEGGGQAVRMEEKDLAFLKQVCGEQLDQPIGLPR